LRDADRPVEDDVEALAEAIPQPDVDAAPKPGQRIELLARAHAVGKAQVAGEVAESPPGFDAVTANVESEHERASRRRPDQVEQQPDRRALAGSVRAEVAEHLAVLHTQLEIGQRSYARAVCLLEILRLDCRCGHRDDRTDASATCDLGPDSPIRASSAHWPMSSSIRAT
jgi:hypothetical protein